MRKRMFSGEACIYSDDALLSHLKEDGNLTAVDLL